jgi:hypothetical protein
VAFARAAAAAFDCYILKNFGQKSKSRQQTMAMAPPHYGAPPTDTCDPTDEAGAKRQRPDRANEAQTQVRIAPACAAA